MSIELSARKSGKRARRGLLGLFLRDASGATAIEFAMLAIPFTMLVFAILESCVSYTAQQVVSGAADDVARQFRTGQLKPDANNQAVVAAKVREMICGRLEVMVAKGCPNLFIDLRQFATFADALNIKTKLTGTGSDRDLDTSDFGINPGLAKTRNMLRVYYKWPVITDFMRASMSNIKGGKILLAATAIWQNEPFEN
ncbi:TadE/TadG family type IV pilus assembly protein [Pseudaminobacter soli (ex Li et al. 2025)]|uniref:Pilus assembly protein n=1 Tax=Pseudaminobacter soli (ex Li et al. 2025) TaxID=1295366 RepID=A0A2P7S627_9HYPH|nr:TadE/TadG family type IV pilus assembly protein [Mesorhizobium soli]PSJ57897.1 pilus assembly protein [Mesorhizobium soli]